MPPPIRHWKRTVLKRSRDGTGSQVTGSAIWVGSGHGSLSVSDPMFDPVLSFINMRVYRGVVLLYRVSE